MKKFLSICLAVVLIITAMPFDAFNLTAAAETSGYYTYTVSNGKATITDVDTSISGNVTIPQTLGGYSVTSIGEAAFYYCFSLRSITIPDSVTSIGNSAFEDCYSLTSITIPDSVTSIGDDAFYDCDSLTSITVDENNRYYSSADGVLFNKNKTELIRCPEGKSGSYVIPNSVTSIGSSAFYDCESLTSITIPDSVTSIGDSAFYYCFSLTSITIGNSVTSIGDYAFLGCSSLRSITIPDSVTSIGNSAFEDCSSLTSITIPDSVTSIGAEAFYDCESLTSITIPDSVTSIGKWAFYGCDSLTNVYYRGSKEDKEIIYFGFSNEDLTDATWYYNSCIVGANHTYDNACDTDCNVCGVTRAVPDHVYDNACDVDCNICGITRAVPDHVYDNACDTDCNICGESRTAPHIYDNACDTDCNVCGKTRTVPDHIYDNIYDAECNVCGFILSTPTVAYKYSGTVALTVIDGFEYSIDGINWQLSNIFTGLLENTTYNFYQRKINTVIDSYIPLTITLKASQPTPSKPIITAFSDTVIYLLAVDGYEYSLDGVNWQSDNMFTNLSPATSYTFYQRLAETKTAEASVMSDSTLFTTDKAEQLLIPLAPTVLTVTANSVTLTPVEGCEYSKDGINWQAGNVFNNLYFSTEYTFYQRYKETSTTYVGESSAGLTVKTLKITSAAPGAPTVLAKTHCSVILVSIAGYEYSLDSVNWQTSNMFTGLMPKMNYMFYQRVAENDEHYASSASPVLTVKTNALLHTPGNINNDEKINLKDLVTLSRYVAGWGVEVTYVAALDVNCDGAVTLEDVNHLSRYLAGWDVSLN